MAGPERIYDVDLDELPPTAELIRKLRAVEVTPRAARLVASWVEMKRLGITVECSKRTEVRYRKALVAAMGKPVPPRPGRAYADQAEPLREVGSADVVATGSMALVALAVMATLYSARTGVGADLGWLLDITRQSLHYRRPRRAITHGRSSAYRISRDARVARLVRREGGSGGSGW